MKKAFSTVMIILLLLAFFGCGSASAEKAEEEKKTTGKTDAVSSATLNVSSIPLAPEKTDGKTLVLWFSPNDTIKAAAYIVADAVNADLMEIVPEEEYSENDLNYNDSSTRATVEQRNDSARPVIRELPDIEQYDTILLGYPIWWGQAPKILYTLFENVDFSGKTVYPFCTSGSSSVVSSAENLSKITNETVTWMPAIRLDYGSSEEDIRQLALSLNGKT